MKDYWERGVKLVLMDQNRVIKKVRDQGIRILKSDYKQSLTVVLLFLSGLSYSDSALEWPVTQGMKLGYWLQTLAYCFCGGSKYLVRMKVSYVKKRKTPVKSGMTKQQTWPCPALTSAKITSLVSGPSLSLMHSQPACN